MLRHFIDPAYLAKKKLEICNKCQFYDASKDKCKLCGCKMKLKTRLAGNHCPIKLHNEDALV